ncbi:hypothetical protein DAT35_31230 [Vitiosangium sp. GDMCC 1.1324]|nr:DUF2381 family protein [Vitiosangium sp. GDMCC 1.1324]PTL79904.1 hypothetical protein DAT35_31230 [Vitiosangium sp. GDMCC 1.1324]
MALPSPLPLLILLALPLGTPATARAQPPTREQQQRQVVVPNSPDEPVPEVRVAANTLTLFRFGASIDRASVEVEGRMTRFRLVDVGDRTLILEMTVEPGPEERLIVRVRYKDGAAPAYATFALVSHPSLVDTLVEVVRRPRTVEALEAALAEKDAQFAALQAMSGPVGLVFSGRLDEHGVRAKRIANIPPGAPHGLEVMEGEGYRAKSWALAVVRVHNLPGQRPWAPEEAHLTRTDGTPVKVLAVHMNKAQLGPGEEGLVAVETEAPSWMEGQDFRLEVMDKSGARQLPILEVKL